MNYLQLTDYEKSLQTLQNEVLRAEKLIISVGRRTISHKQQFKDAQLVIQEYESRFQDAEKRLNDAEVEKQNFIIQAKNKELFYQDSLKTKETELTNARKQQAELQKHQNSFRTWKDNKALRLKDLRQKIKVCSKENNNIGIDYIINSC